MTRKNPTLGPRVLSVQADAVAEMGWHVAVSYKNGQMVMSTLRSSESGAKVAIGRKFGGWKKAEAVGYRIVPVDIIPVTIGPRS